MLWQSSTALIDTIGIRDETKLALVILVIIMGKIFQMKVIARVSLRVYSDKFV